MKYAQYAKTEKPISSFVPYTRFVDESTLRTKDGYLLQVIKLDGLAFETAETEDLNHYKNVRGNLIHNLSDSRFVLYHHIIRREVHESLDSFFENDFCRQLDQVYGTKLAQKRMFKNEHYISVLRRPTPGILGLADKIGRVLSNKIDKQLYEQTLRGDLKALTSETKGLIEGLALYSPKLLTLQETEAGTLCPSLSFLGLLLNLEDAPVALPDGGIDTYLPKKRLSFGKETFEVRGAANGDIKLGAMLSVKKYGTHTATGMLDGLLRLPHEFILTQSYACVDMQTSLNRIRDCQRKMVAGEQGAVSLEGQLDQAIDEVASGLTTFGDHHLSLCAIGKSAPELDKAVNAALNVFKPLGVHAVREDVNMEPVFWSQLSGNLSYIARSSMISNHNFAGFTGFHNFPAGQRSGNHWGEAVTCLETTSGTPYWFNFHEPKRDVGNFTVFGPTGYGKTVLLSFLHAQAQKFKPKSFFFDKDRGAEVYLRAIGGEYNVISSGLPSGLNPLQIDDTPENRAFLRDWLQILLRTETRKDFTAVEREMIADVVNANFEAPFEHRRLSVLCKLFGGFEHDIDETLQERLSMWHSGGERAWLFDNPQDTLSLSAQTIGFDMTSILDDPVSRTPWLFYIFHRIRNALAHKKKTLIMLDEGWKLLDDPVFAYTIKDWLKTVRKQGGLVGFATQSTGDATNSVIGATILEQSPTQIFLPNPKAREEEYCGHFRLTERELYTIRNLTAQSRCFLIKQGKDSVIAKLDLSGMNDFISILSGRTENIRILDEVREEFSTPEEWIPHFIERIAA